MAGQTSNYGIRFPEMLDPANINAVQFIAEDSEEELGSLLDEVVSDSSTKVSWTQVAWTPTVGAMTLGNGSVTGKAYRLGQQAWVEFTIDANAVGPTTAFVANQFPTVALPSSMPVLTTGIAHGLATCKLSAVNSSVMNLATELGTGVVAILAIEGAMRIFNFPATYLGVSPWSAGDYIRCGLLYVTTNAS